MLDLLIDGGTVVTADNPPFPANVGVQDGRVAGLYVPHDRPDARDVVDATGMIVLPGLMDAHVHPGVYRDLAEDLGFMTGFALRGGITSIVAFHRPQAPYAQAIPAAREVFTDASHIDFGFILGVTQTHQIADIGVAIDAGINAFKFYLGYCGHEERFESDFPFTDTYLTRVMEAIAATPGDPLLCVHCENADIAQHYQRSLPADAEQTLETYDHSYPVAAEADSAVHVSLLGHLLGIRTCIVHVSAGTTGELLAGLPWRDPKRSVLETCMHYLTLTTDDPAGLRAVVRPPVRNAGERERLWAQVLAGTIDTIGSDHCSSDLEQKPDMDLSSCTLGFGETGLTLPLLLSEGFHRRGMPLQQIAEVTSRNIAQAHGLYPRKGTIQPGSDADLVIVDLDREQLVDPTALKGRPDGSVYEGRRLRGWPIATIAGGRQAQVDGELLIDTGNARFMETQT